MNRKEAIHLMTGGSLTLGLAGSGFKWPAMTHTTSLKGNINHSACRWCYGKIPLDDLCRQAKEIGLVGIDLLKPEEWQTAFDHGLTCTMAYPEYSSLTEGFNDPKMHGKLQDSYRKGIVLAAEAGLKNMICFSGNRNGLADDAGLENCATGLEPLVKLAEQHNIILQMELLNSKVNHPDYQCDKSPWGVALVEKIGSPNFKLLYDIYHMQIMEGDVIATIRQNKDYYGHYHTGGVPGRHEINETQELYYPAIMQAIVDTGFQGYVAQEFIPTGDDPIASLRHGVMTCDV
ncbi:MAG: TIM barrel protein [Saprospiraceae bacterium]|nr:TIM barrel protein [Saprospiraceae bacterium]